MIAVTRRLAIHDFLLIACSVVVILLSAAPERDHLQTVEVRDASGAYQRYSLAADDPRIGKLQRELANWPKRLPNRSLTLAKWHVELAEFYIGRTKPVAVDAPVQQVAFSVPGVKESNAESLAEQTSLSAERDYWHLVRDKAQRAIADGEEKLQQRERNSGPPPIVIGELSRPGRSPRDFGIAAVGGLSVALLFAAWVHVCPPIRLREDRPTSEIESSSVRREGARRELKLSIPSQWVRIHQPMAVNVRRFAFAALVVAAFVCLTAGIA